MITTFLTALAGVYFICMTPRIIKSIEENDDTSILQLLKNILREFQ